MERDIVMILKNYSVEVLVIAVLSFLLTYLVKSPIKKLTSKFDDNKRKMINFIIIFIPLILSLIMFVIYSGLTSRKWFSLTILNNSTNSWLLALSLYAIVSRIWIVIKGIKSGKVSVNSSLVEDVSLDIKNEVEALSSQVASDESTLTVILEKIGELVKKRNTLASEENLDLEKISDVNMEIKNLKKQEKELEEKIQCEQNSLLDLEQN